MITYVSTGEVHWMRETGALVCDALGSCIGIAAFNMAARFAVMAHVMLPGYCPYKEYDYKLRYAGNAMEHLIMLFDQRNIGTGDVIVCIAGGANVLMRHDDTVCEPNIASVEQLLSGARIQVAARSLGGTLRRSLRFDVNSGVVYYTIGDSREMVLYSFYQKQYA